MQRLRPVYKESIIALAAILLGLLQAGAQNDASEGLTLFSLGDSITRYNGSIECAELDWNGTAPVVRQSGTCHMFKYLPALKDSLLLASVPFGDVVLTADSSGIIREVMFLKHYLKDGAINPKRLVSKEFELLKNYMTSFTKQSLLVVKYDRVASAHYTQEEFTWHKDGIKFTMIFTSFKADNRKRRLTNAVSFSFAG